MSREVQCDDIQAGQMCRKGQKRGGIIQPAVPAQDRWCAYGLPAQACKLAERCFKQNFFSLFHINISILLARLQIRIGQHQPLGARMMKIDVHPRVFSGSFKSHDYAFAEFCMGNILAEAERPVLALNC